MCACVRVCVYMCVCMCVCCVCVCVCVCVFGEEHDNSEWVDAFSTLMGGPDSGCSIFLIV